MRLAVDSVHNILRVDCTSLEIHSVCSADCTWWCTYTLFSGITRSVYRYSTCHDFLE